MKYRTIAWKQGWVFVLFFLNGLSCLYYLHCLRVEKRETADSFE
jgi:hypothetical protein